MRALAETASVEQMICAAGFASLLEFRDLLMLVPLETFEQRKLFQTWLESDGTKAGLLCALARWPRSHP